jgi:hypothetical protein
MTRKYKTVIHFPLNDDKEHSPAPLSKLFNTSTGGLSLDRNRQTHDAWDDGSRYS